MSRERPQQAVGSDATLFAINCWLRSSYEAPTGSLVLMSGIGIALLGISGWLGGELVYRQGVAVEKVSE